MGFSFGFAGRTPTGLRANPRCVEEKGTGKAVLSSYTQKCVELCRTDPVQIRKNPATGSTPKSRVYGIQSVAWEFGLTEGDAFSALIPVGVGGSLGDS